MKKKRIIPSDMRIMSIALGCIVFIVSILYLIYYTTTPKIQTEDILIYNHTEKLTYSYDVNLKENPIYGPITLEPNRYYPLRYTDSFKIRFDYSYSGQVPTKLTGSYSIYTLLQGFTIREDKVHVLWQKKEDPLLVTNLNKKGQDMDFSEEFLVPLDPYMEFTKLLEEDNISSQYRLVVMVKMDVNKSNDFNSFNDSYEPTFVIPLSNTFIHIESPLETKNENPVMETETREIPPKTGVIVFLALIGMLSLGGSLYLIFFTKALIKSPKDKKTAQLFKKYGARLIGTLQDPERTNSMTITLQSMEDLVHLSDELIKPIFYHAEKNPSAIKEFYIIHENKIYLYPYETWNTPMTKSPISSSKLNTPKQSYEGFYFLVKQK